MFMMPTLIKIWEEAVGAGLPGQSAAKTDEAFCDLGEAMHEAATLFALFRRPAGRNLGSVHKPCDFYDSSRVFLQLSGGYQTTNKSAENRLALAQKPSIQ
jgi:hypothetical protein